jgi:hypothetical protein
LLIHPAVLPSFHSAGLPLFYLLNRRRFLGRMPQFYRHFAALPRPELKEGRTGGFRASNRPDWSKVTGTPNRNRPVPPTVTHPRHRRVARREDLALTRREFSILGRLATPQQIQSFLNATPINHETEGETILSVREVLAQRRAHCIEAAFVAACALWIHGEPPVVMHLDCASTDYPHVVALFRRAGHWGAISKSNGTPLRYRDPIYRSLRELALSYFHEYSDKRGRKTLRSYSAAFDLRRIDPALWVTHSRNCREVNDRLAGARHYPLVTSRQQTLLSRRDGFERLAAKTVEYPPPAVPIAARRKSMR